MASVLSLRSDSLGQRAAERKVPMAPWEKYGLLSAGWFRSRAAEPRYAKLPRTARFRLALEEAGGLFPSFALFLAGRADLLPSPYLHEIRKIRLSQKISPAPTLDRELARRISGVAAIRATPGFDAFRAVYQNRSIIVEVYRSDSNPIPEKTWEDFRKKVRKLDDGPEAVIWATPVLEQFREWLQIQADVERKRKMLGNLQDFQSHSVSRFPRLIPELQQPTCLVYEAMEGVPLDRELLPNSGTAAKSLQILAESILEQALLLSLIDTEARLENLLVLPDGGLGFRVLPAWVPVPVESQYELVQYLATAVAGNTPRALQMLCRISRGRNAYQGEQELLSRLSSLQPELKINVTTPESVTVLENYWRALAGAPLHPPLFLHLFHRNLTLLGQYNESVAPATDVIAESLWPVLAGLVRFRLGRLFSTEKSREWIVSSALLFLTTARQAALALEHLREDYSELTAVLERKDSDLREATLKQRTTSVIHSAVGLAMFLFFFQLARSQAGGPWPFLSRAAAAISAVILTILVARIK